MSLLDHDQLALWYRQGPPKLFGSGDRPWVIGDATGATVGTAFADGGLFDVPDYWMWEADGGPALGIRHADGIRARYTHPWHTVVWGDGSEVGFFHEGFVHWQGTAVARWRVDSRSRGETAYFDGAWLWDPSEQLVATVGRVDDANGAYLQLTRSGDPDDCLKWCSLALLLVAREHHRRAQSDAARARNRSNRRRFD
jgi:hypothetical protein